jgi:hypothetical protein
MSSNNLINDLTVDEIIHKNILIEEMFYKSHIMFRTVIENFENYKKINQQQQKFNSKYNSLLLCLYINLPDLSFPEFEFEENLELISKITTTLMEFIKYLVHAKINGINILFFWM